MMMFTIQPIYPIRTVEAILAYPHLVVFVALENYHVLGMVCKSGIVGKFQEVMKQAQNYAIGLACMSKPCSK
jgi:hypothetical protein